MADGTQNYYFIYKKAYTVQNFSTFFAFSGTEPMRSVVLRAKDMLQGQTFRFFKFHKRKLFIKSNIIFWILKRTFGSISMLIFSKHVAQNPTFALRTTDFRK
jgi:hypothetical protein